MLSMEARSNNRILTRNNLRVDAMEMVLGRRIVTSRENVTVVRAPHDSPGPTQIIDWLAVDVFAKTRSGNNKKPRKTK